MSERPIPFSGPMVRAILDGRKVQTRRVVSPGVLEYFGGADGAHVGWYDEAHSGPGWYVHAHEYPDEGCSLVRCPYGVPGDTLWVKETHAIRHLDYWRDRDEDDDSEPLCMEAEEVYYKATPRVGLRRWVGPTAPAPDAFQGRPHRMTYLDESSPLEWGPAARVERWRSPRFMPRWASRLTLRVESVRVGRVGDITEEDARAEGVEPVEAVSPLGPYRWGFARLWDSINGKRPGAAWADSPWVWVVGFSRVSP